MACPRAQVTSRRAVATMPAIVSAAAQTARRRRRRRRGGGVLWSGPRGRFRHGWGCSGRRKARMRRGDRRRSAPRQAGRRSCRPGCGRSRRPRRRSCPKRATAASPPPIRSAVCPPVSANGTSRAWSERAPIPNPSATPTRPSATPARRLAAALAASTRERRGAKRKVGLIVRCRYSLVISMTPARAEKRPAMLPTLRRPRWSSAVVRRGVGEEVGQEREEDDQSDHACDESERGAGRADPQQPSADLVDQGCSCAVRSRKTSSSEELSETSS